MNNRIITLVIGVIVFLIGGVYIFSKSAAENKIGTVTQPEITASPSPTGNLQSSVSGFAAGKICFPSESGYIEAKRLSDGQFFIQNTSNSTYNFELKPEKYHLRYVVGGIGDFATYSYNLSETDTVVEADVQSNKTLAYDLCETSTTNLQDF